MNLVKVSEILQHSSIPGVIPIQSLAIDSRHFDKSANGFRGPADERMQILSKLLRLEFFAQNTSIIAIKF